MRLLILSLVSLYVLATANGYVGPYNRFYKPRPPAPDPVEDDPGEPLFLTPYLEQGKIDDARRLR
jgi:hypothetical protein